MNRELDQLKRLWSRFDKNHIGFIDAKELGKLLEAHGSSNDEAVLEALANLKTKNKDRVTWDEFRVWWSGVSRAPRSKPRPWELDETSPEAPTAVAGDFSNADLHVAFSRFDADRSGTIETRELSRLFEALGQQPDDEAIADAMKSLDKDGNGTISFDELAAWWDERA
jgi:calcium-binding protein CML